MSSSGILPIQELGHGLLRACLEGPTFNLIPRTSAALLAAFEAFRAGDYSMGDGAAAGLQLLSALGLYGSAFEPILLHDAK